MPNFILTDSRVRKDDPERRYIKTLPIPDGGKIFYTDLHKDAPRRLMLCVSHNGSKAWVLHYYMNGKPRRITIGKYPAWGPVRARLEATQIRAEIDSGVDPLVEREAEQHARLKNEAARKEKSDLTLGTLLLAYVDQLNQKGKTSARAVDNCVKKNVELAFPKLWIKPAEDIDLDDCVDIVAALAEQDKMREAAKLRSYLRAAYTAAVKALGDASAVPALRKFKLKYNPAAALATIEGNIRARERVLSLPELKVYWKRITALPSPDGPVLTFHLLTGGQRLVQLFRLKDRDRDDDTVTLHDPKGRRQKTPRPCRPPNQGGQTGPR